MSKSELDSEEGGDDSRRGLVTGECMRGLPGETGLLSGDAGLLVTAGVAAPFLRVTGASVGVLPPRNQREVNGR